MRWMRRILHAEREDHTRRTITEDCMATTLAPEDVQQLWLLFKADPSNQDLRNRLVEQYLPLVKYNGERIWARMPGAGELDGLGSSRGLGLLDSFRAFHPSS